MMKKNTLLLQHRPSQGEQPYWLALCFRANRKTAEGCDPVSYVTRESVICTSCLCFVLCSIKTAPFSTSCQ